MQLNFTIILLFRILGDYVTSGYFNGFKSITAEKGSFLVEVLHSANFFDKTVKVKWETTLKGKPALPSWLQLLPSRHPELAYLIGTPTSNVTQTIVEVIAKRLDSFEIRTKTISINVQGDKNFVGSVKEVLEITLNDIDVETLLSNRERKINQLEKAIRRTFAGSGVNPIIISVGPKNEIPKGKEHLFKNDVGTKVSIGTHRNFYPRTVDLLQKLNGRPKLCWNPNNVTLNFHFAGFNVDWCNTNLKTVRADKISKLEKQTITPNQKQEKTIVVKDDQPEEPPKEVYGYTGYNFYNSVILFPAIGIICVILLLVLSMIFFGTREGQNWRDYKTSRDKLEEYVSVRESQKHLRELSVQRQLISMAHDNSAPSGVHSFLQPRSRAQSSIARFSKSASRLNEREDTVELIPVDHIPVGKQTVAEAAKQCGSSLHLYRNPLDSESDENDSDCSDD